MNKEFDEKKSYTDIDELILKNNIKKQFKKIFINNNGYISKLGIKCILICSISLLLGIIKLIIRRH